MAIHTLPAQAAMQRMDSFDTVIDARSEDEYAEDRLPSAINWPTLNNAERIGIGTLYRQVGPFEARRQGAVLAARNIASHIEREVLDKPKTWKPLIYCWRGGHRSHALATVLGTIGFRVTLIEGGYKGWRNALLAELPARIQQLQFLVICGTTGSGKTRLLQTLAAQGAQVLDLEALASHRSSVLGHLPGRPQPSQKRFDSLVWEALSSFDPSRRVYVECESKKVGNVRVPESLVDAMHRSPCAELRLDNEQRVSLLLEDYAHFVQDPAQLCERLQSLTELRGKATVSGWIDAIRTGQLPDVVLDLLVNHYDPRYQQSMGRHFVQHAQAMPLTLADRSSEALESVAATLIAGETEGTNL